MTGSPRLPLTLFNADAFPRDASGVLGFELFRDAVTGAIRNGGRLVCLFGRPQADSRLRLAAVLASVQSGELAWLETEIEDSYPSLTPDCPQAHYFERELAEQWGVKPLGHPWLKPVRFHKSYRSPRDAWDRSADGAVRPGVTDFFRVDGDETHAVAVGPVHAGVIEPGHFRFACHGETVLHLEIALGYQHRGIERRLAGGPGPRTLPWMETVAGDTSIGHALAYCQAVEALANWQAPARAQALRAVALELERLANHTGDLGALANDVAYLPTAAFCGRLRGEYLNLTAALCGNRFGRGLLVPGGVAHDLTVEEADRIACRLEQVYQATAEAVQLLWDTPSVLARFEDAGRVSRKACRRLGLVGPAARACGFEQDVRTDFPAGMYTMAHIPLATWHAGDVFSRAYVRWLEIQRSAAFVLEQLRGLPGGPVRSEAKPLLPGRAVVSLTEGWRGEICHVALTDGRGTFQAYKITDPSFHNWMGLALAMRNQPISDFPLCNKSFNLSYCGHDL